MSHKPSGDIGQKLAPTKNANESMMFPIISTWSCPTSRHLRVALFVLGHVVAWGLCAVDTVMMPPFAKSADGDPSPFADFSQF